MPGDRKGAALAENRPGILVTASPGEANVAGGLNTHRRRLVELLDPISQVTVVDFGGSSASIWGRFEVLAQLFKIAFLVRRVNWGAFFVNSPMHLSSCAKLGLLLAIIPVETVRKTFVFFHGGRLCKSTGSQVLAWIAGFLFRRGARFFFLSSLQHRQFQEVWGSNIPTAPYNNFSAKDEPTPSHTANGVTRFLYVGRLIELKGAFEAIESFARICTENPSSNCSMKVCGDGPLAQELQECYSELVLADRLQFLGHISGDELANAYSQSDVLVFPTRYPEGFPYVLVEAYQHRLCVLATSEGALADHVIDEVTGFHVQPTVEDLKYRMHQLMRDADLLNRLRAGAGEHFRKHFAFRLGQIFYSTLVPWSERK